ncbi:uncharacterized protein Z518_02922 [Rhinocladiella mackenziei CBS 650.93]|uniref:Rhinocladiella mackenziei CBS 650.93 unplaced genomic scaffold supercont1.2, whole genome shotgun sequence n=1 Tax=Rhinocladiella mackenziei CBS 650.93 TaxID=1442369 RepID=A0A0D2IXY8_9EURO|nr:uncharacterized protein Z518_02922 [Rhinocladiella mackenziei CBS 650.93]KIX08266.1 hypothetical protein Z518_02922 [Rhinocladiella mackenziei CBS 650.93]
MPNGTFFQSASTPPPQMTPSSPPLSHTSSTVKATTTTATSSDLISPNDAATKLAEAIDDFLGNLEKKFKGISDEILTKLDDMAERCDRLEQEMLLRDASALETVRKTPTGSTTGSA